MAKSGTYVFNPQLADQIDEGFERCGVDPSDLNSRHVRSAVRSANLVMADWQNFGYKQFTLVKITEVLTSVGQQSFTLPTGGFDIFHATLKRDGRESEMYSFSRSDYNALHDKAVQGRPDRYFVDKSTYIGDTPASTVFIWQAAERTTDTLEIWYMRKHDDAGSMSNTIDLSPNYQEAFACAMAFHLSRKFSPDKSKTLKADYLGENYDEFKHSIPGGAMGRALAEDRDTSDLVMRARFDRYRGKR